MSALEAPENQSENIDSKIRAAFNGRPLNAKDLLIKLTLNWTTQKLTSYLKKSDLVVIVKLKNTNLFELKVTSDTSQPTYAFG